MKRRKQAEKQWSQGQRKAKASQRYAAARPIASGDLRTLFHLLHLSPEMRWAFDSVRSLGPTHVAPAVTGSAYRPRPTCLHRESRRTTAAVLSL